MCIRDRSRGFRLVIGWVEGGGREILAGVCQGIELGCWEAGTSCVSVDMLGPKEVAILLVDVE